MMLRGGSRLGLWSVNFLFSKETTGLCHILSLLLPDSLVIRRIKQDAVPRVLLTLFMIPIQFRRIARRLFLLLSAALPQRLDHSCEQNHLSPDVAEF